MQVLSEFCTILKVFEDATKIACQTIQPSIYTSTSNFETMLTAIDLGIEVTYIDRPLIQEGLLACKEKLIKYYDKTSPLCNLATILDPNKNLYFFERLVRNGRWEQEWVDDIKAMMKQSYLVYKAKFIHLA